VEKLTMAFPVMKCSWGDVMKLHLALAGTNHVGTGTGVRPQTALVAGLKLSVRFLYSSQPACQGWIHLTLVG
jgi:hypothetical protein